MDNSYIESLRKDVKRALKSDKMRFRHTIGVADTSACLASRYGVDMQKAYISGLLHDCAKCVPDEQKITECEQNNIEITKSEYESPYLLHSKLGAFYADVKYGIKDEDILGAIKWHTTGHPDMTMLEKIVFVADYIEPYRNKAANLDTIRYLAFTDIDKAVLQILDDTINYLNKKGNPIDSITLDTSKQMAKVAVEALKEKKGYDVKVIDISEISILADYFIIANGSNANQVQAMVDNVEEQMYKAGFDDPKVEGYNNASWILLDYNDVVLHIFDEESRSFYNLERLWRDGKEVDVDTL